MEGMDMGDFIRMIMENGGEGVEIPKDVAEQISNKKAANTLIRQDLESEYATLQAGLMDERIANDKAEMEASAAKAKFQKLRSDLLGGALALGIIAGTYLTIIFCVWATKQL